MQQFQHAASDRIVLGLLVAVLLAVTAFYVRERPSWWLGAQPRAHWCKEGETPAFHFGFAELAAQLGGTMGEPTECEHGEDWSTDTRQATTTGVAVYRWCTNTPAFIRGQERWALMPDGMQHWSGDAGPPRPFALVRVPDLRHPCTADI